jgi:hypothetical protein
LLTLVFVLMQPLAQQVWLALQVCPMPVFGPVVGQQLPAWQVWAQQTFPAPHCSSVEQAWHVPFTQNGFAGSVQFVLSQHSWQPSAQQSKPPVQAAPSLALQPHWWLPLQSGALGSSQSSSPQQTPFTQMGGQQRLPFPPAWH